MAHPVFKTGGARQIALEGSTPSPFRMSDRDRLRDRRARQLEQRQCTAGQLLLDPRTLTDDEAREVARAVRAASL